MITTEERIAELYEMQDELNRKIERDWKARRFEFSRAIWVECAEMMDHLQFKWWKKTKLDLDAARMELVDIFHFLISWDMVENDVGLYASLAASFEDMEVDSKPIGENDIASLDFLRHTIDQLAMAAADNCIVLSNINFIEVMEIMGMNFNDLYKMYIGKNALNEFRVMNGYNEGTYEKFWEGKEDNEHLTEIIKSEVLNIHDVHKSIMFYLDLRYRNANY